MSLYYWNAKYQTYIWSTLYVWLSRYWICFYCILTFFSLNMFPLVERKGKVRRNEISEVCKNFVWGSQIHIKAAATTLPLQALLLLPTTRCYYHYQNNFGETVHVFVESICSRHQYYTTFRFNWAALTCSAHAVFMVWPNGTIMP